jgi:hypothetical protein
VHAVAAFGYAQIAYASALSLVYAAYYAPELLRGGARDDTRRIQPAQPWVDAELLVLSRSFTVQAFWKLVLAEAEKAVMVLYGRPDDQARAPHPADASPRPRDVPAGFPPQELLAVAGGIPECCCFATPPSGAVRSPRKPNHCLGLTSV